MQSQLCNCKECLFFQRPHIIWISFFSHHILMRYHVLLFPSLQAIITKDSELPTRQAPDSGTTSLSSDNSSSGHSVDCLRDSDLGRKLENSSICSSKMPVSEARTETTQCNNPVGFYLHQTTSDSLGNVLQDCFMDSRSANVQANVIKHENVYEFDDALDNVVLRERRNLLLSRWYFLSTNIFLFIVLLCLGMHIKIYSRIMQVFGQIE